MQRSFRRFFNLRDKNDFGAYEKLILNCQAILTVQWGVIFPGQYVKEGEGGVKGGLGCEEGEGGI